MLADIHRVVITTIIQKSGGITTVRGSPAPTVASVFQLLAAAASLSINQAWSRSAHERTHADANRHQVLPLSMQMRVQRNSESTSRCYVILLERDPSVFYRYFRRNCLFSPYCAITLPQCTDGLVLVDHETSFACSRALR